MFISTYTCREMEGKRSELGGWRREVRAEPDRRLCAGQDEGDGGGLPGQRLGSETPYIYIHVRHSFASIDFHCAFVYTPLVQERIVVIHK